MAWRRGYRDAWLLLVRMRSNRRDCGWGRKLERVLRGPSVFRELFKHGGYWWRRGREDGRVLATDAHSRDLLSYSSGALWRSTVPFNSIRMSQVTGLKIYEFFRTGHRSLHSSKKCIFITFFLSLIRHELA
jgi:hypothetical protein